MAEPALKRVAGDLRHAPHVDADRRQSPARADASRQPLVDVPLYVSSRGLTTSAIPYGRRVFEIEFDFIDHHLNVKTGDGATATVALEPRTVADFYRALMAELSSLGIEVDIYTLPVEIPDPIRFTEDSIHASYDPEYANRLWRILVQSNKVFNEFRARFIGKCSPVHFYWGSFDLAVARLPVAARPHAKARTQSRASLTRTR